MKISSEYRDKGKSTEWYTAGISVAVRLLDSSVVLITER